METKTFSTNSFVYRFLAWPQGFLPNRLRPQDICDLRRAVIGKALLYLFLTSIVLLYFYFIASAGLYGLSKISVLFAAYSAKTMAVRAGMGLALATASLAVILGLGFGLVAATVWFGNYRDKRKAKRDKDGLKPIFYPVTNSVKELYQSWKDKLCYRVTFE